MSNAIQSPMPEGMVQVTKEEFYKAIGQLNVGPCSEKYHTEWRFIESGRPSSRLWGWSSRGWCGPFDHQGTPPEIYAIMKGQVNA